MPWFLGRQCARCASCCRIQLRIWRRATFIGAGACWNLLAAVAIVYLICDPGQLFEAGFQLSFLAVAAIGALAIPLLEATSAPFSRSVLGIREISRDVRMEPRAAQFRLRELRLLAETLYYYLRMPQEWDRPWTCLYCPANVLRLGNGHYFHRNSDCLRHYLWQFTFI